MKISYLLMIGISTVSLAGCTNRHLEDRKATEAVCNAVAIDPALKLVVQDAPVNLDDVTVEMMVDKRKFSPEQKKAMAQSQEVIDRCNASVRVYVEKYSAPSAMPIHEAYWRGERLLQAEAIQTDMSIGTYNETRVRLYQNYVAELMAEKRQRELKAMRR